MRAESRYYGNTAVEFPLSGLCVIFMRLFRLPYFLGGVQQDQHQSYTLFAECDLRVQGHRADGAHHLHNRSGWHDLERPRPAVLVDHLLWCPSRSVTQYTQKWYDTGRRALPLCWFHSIQVPLRKEAKQCTCYI